MTQPAGDEEAIGTLVGRLADEAKALAKAELDLARAIATVKARAIRVPAIKLAVALLLAQAAMVMLGVAIMVLVAIVAGPLVGAIVAVLVAGGTALLLAKSAAADLEKLK